jgi:hypothetical protein
MGCVLKLERSEYSVVWLPIKPPVGATLCSADDPKNDPLCGNEASPATPDPRPMSRYLVAFCISVVAILAWQSCSDAARQLVETSSLQFPGLAPVAHITPDVIAPVTIAAPSLDKQHLAWLQENVDQRTAGQRQINLLVVQPASAQQQITRDFDSLQQVERHTISKVSVPLPRPVPAERRKYASGLATTTAGTSQSARHAATSSTSFGSSLPSPVVSMRLDPRRHDPRSAL